jgi:hypothetical protein
MKRTLACIAAAAVLSAVPTIAAETMKGRISDSMCGAKHSSGEHGGAAMSDRACVEKCVKSGEKYVFVSGDKIYKIANQDFAGLKTHAGHEVMLTGDTKNDTITVSKIEMPAANKDKK